MSLDDYLKRACSDLPPDPRPAKGLWAPGTYCCVCNACKKLFTGNKDAVQCAPCAYGLEVSTSTQKVAP